MSQPRLAPISAAFLSVVFFALPINAQAENTEVTVRIVDHKFDPAEVRVPAGEKIRMIVINEDDTPEEFESHSLKREKIIQGGSKATIMIGPLEPGEYPFFGEFNEDSAQGVIIAE